jgi:WD40 repeat protein
MLSNERPFPGLRPFVLSDHAFFFGREEQSFELFRRLDRSRFIAVVGSSGSGKSSLVRAGLQPLIAEETSQAGGRAWRWIELRPGDAPLTSLATALSNVLPASDDPAADSGRRDRFAFVLRQSRFGLTEAVSSIGDLRHVTPLIFVDQFEELFRYAMSGERGQLSSREEATQFVQLLLQATYDRTHPVHVLLTMRSDFIGDCARFHGLPEAVSASQFLVPSLTRDQRESVIRGPIKAAGATIEPALVERLLNDSSEELDELPVLQHCLQRLWEAALPARSRGSPRLQLSHYAAIGGVSGALSRHADEIMASLPIDELAVEQVFRALSEVDHEGRATRRAITFEQLFAESGVGEEGLRRVLDRFRADDCCFVVPSLSTVPTLTLDTRIDVGHEALLRRWDKITIERASEVDRREGGWLWQEEDDGRTYRALLALLEYGRTLPLDQVETRLDWWGERPRTAAWAKRYGGQIERVQQLFQDSHDALAAERERQLDAERAERERLEERAAASRQLARRTRNAAIAMGLLALIATGFGIFGLIEAREARLQGEAAERAARIAENKTAEATASLSEARLNESRLLVSRAETELGNGNAALASLLALAALPDDMRHPDRPLLPPAVEILARARNAERTRTILTGHSDRLGGATWSPDGTRIATASSDASAGIWDSKTGALLMMLKGHAGTVYAAVWSPDGSRIATASEDNTARIWDAKTGEQLQVLKGHTAAVVNAAWSPDGTRVATSSRDSTARIWDAKTGIPVRTLEGHTSMVQAVAWSPDGKRILTGSDDNTVRIWNDETGAILKVLELEHNGWVRGAAWSPDGSLIATSSWGTLQVWDSETGAPLRVLQRSAYWFYSVSWSPDGSKIVTGSDDATARIWDATSGAPLAVLEGHTKLVRDAAWSPDGERIVTAAEDNTARVWDVAAEPKTLNLEGHSDAVFDATVSPNGSLIATASIDHTARIWDMATGRLLNTLTGHTATVRSITWSPDGQQVVTAAWDNTVRLWDVKTGSVLKVLEGSPAWVYVAVWSPDGSRILTGSADDMARVWDARTGEILRVLAGHTAWIQSAAWSPDGSHLVTGSADNTARIWDANTGAVTATLRGHTELVNSVAYSPDGTKIVTAGDKTARIWDAKSGQLLKTLEGHTDLVLAAAWSPDGSRIVTGSADNTVRIWDAETAATLALLEGHTDRVNSAVYSPDGKHIVSASADNSARIWGAWPLLTGDTVTYAAVSAFRGLGPEERVRLFQKRPSAGESLPAVVVAAEAGKLTGSSLKELAAAAAKGNPFAHRLLAERYEKGDGVEPSLDRALLHHAVEARLFEAVGNEAEAVTACARRASDARSLPPEVAVRTAYEAMDWRSSAER